MGVHILRLVWKRDGDDVKLGECYLATRPQKDDLLSYPSPQAPEQSGVWRIVLVYHQPFVHGSPTWRAWRERGEQPESAADVWVEPADGPWER